jgi:hypothetical protein
MTWRPRLLVAATVVALAAQFVALRLGEHGTDRLLAAFGATAELVGVDHPGMLRDGRLVAHDVYGGVFPNLEYAVRCARRGGAGLLWNPYQNCGQPFFAMVTNALLYPPHLLAALVGADRALRLIPFVNLVVAGAFTYLLCRELGAGVAAALCGAAAFELGNGMTDVTVWVPLISGSYAWLPAAMWCCERAIRVPSAARAAALGIVLALQALAGFPQLLVYTYQLVGLRLLWELATARRARPLSAAVAVAAGLALAPLLAAVQLVPSVEVTAHSVRNTGLSIEDMAIVGFLDWPEYRLTVGGHVATYQPLLVVSLVLAAVAWLRSRSRRDVAFFTLAGAAFFVLAFGPNTPLFRLYVHLPLTDLFRDPKRLTWLTSFCLAVLTAFGADAVLGGEAPRTTRATATAAVAVAAAAAVLAFRRLAPDGIEASQWAIGGVAVAACVAGATGGAWRRVAGPLLGVALLLELVVVPARTYQYLLPDASPLFAYAPMFARLRARLTPQDRVDFDYDEVFNTRFAFGPKSASLYEVPCLTDYQPQVSRRYAEFFLMMRTGVVPPRLPPTDFYWRVPLQPAFRRRLLDLTAARYLLVARVVDHTNVVTAPPLRLLDDDGTLRLYENPTALPRAFWVPHVETVGDPAALLQRLAYGDDDPRSVAFVDAPLASGFEGAAAHAGEGRVAFVRNDPEHLTLQVDAPDRGFVFLADQYFPGWTATVNGTPTPVVRADYAFRLVEIPRGPSTVDLRYTARTVRLGATVTVLTIIGLWVVLRLTSPRRRL